MESIADIVRKGRRLRPDSEALVCGTTRRTYAQIDDRTNRLGHAMQTLGIGKGDRVAILSDNSVEYMELFFGAAKIGAVTVPINTRLSPPEMRALVDRAAPSLVFAGKGYGDRTEALGIGRRVGIGLSTGEASGFFDYEALLAAAPSSDPESDSGEDDLAMLVFTGGTTGQSKGVLLSHRNLLTAITAVVISFGFREDDITCQPLPLFHVAFWPTFSHLFVGGKSVILPRVDIHEIAETIQRERCTNINAVPTLYTWMIDDPSFGAYDLSSLRCITYSGSPFPQEPLRRCIKRFGPIFVQGYGMTEAAPLLAFLGPKDHHLEGARARLLRSAGRETALTRIRIVDDAGAELPPGAVGEVVARGHNIMRGYWNNPELTAERLRDGWLRTGDLGYLDEEGYLFLVDRKADMIVTGGENVYPKEVEDVLYTHPAVRECAVASAPDPKWTERVQAAIVLQDGATATEEELIAHCAATLARYKCPKKIEFWDQIPKSGVGKILRREVKDVFWASHDTRISN